MHFKTLPIYLDSLAHLLFQPKLKLFVFALSGFIQWSGLCVASCTDCKMLDLEVFHCALVFCKQWYVSSCCRTPNKILYRFLRSLWGTGSQHDFVFLCCSWISSIWSYCRDIISINLLHSRDENHSKRCYAAIAVIKQKRFLRTGWFCQSKSCLLRYS